MRCPSYPGPSTRVEQLPEIDQQILSSWVAMKIIISEFGPFESTISHHMTRKRVWKSRHAPDDWSWRILIGNYSGRKADTLWLAMPMLILKPEIAKKRKTTRATYVNSQAVTYVFGKLFIHIIRSPHKRLIRNWQFPLVLARRLRQVWPPTGASLLWPIDPLNDTEAHAIAGAFFEFVGRSRS
jgi:hypothetical protein